MSNEFTAVTNRKIRKKGDNSQQQMVSLFSSIHHSNLGFAIYGLLNDITNKIQANLRFPTGDCFVPRPEPRTFSIDASPPGLPSEDARANILLSAVKLLDCNEIKYFC